MPRFPWTPTNTSVFESQESQCCSLRTEQGRMPSCAELLAVLPWPPGMWLGGNTWVQPRGAAGNALQAPGQGQHTWRGCWTAGCPCRVIYGSLQMAGSSHRALDQNPRACSFLKGALLQRCKLPLKSTALAF